MAIQFQVKGSIQGETVPLLMVPMRCKFVMLVALFCVFLFCYNKLLIPLFLFSETSVGSKSKFWYLEYLDW